MARLIPMVLGIIVTVLTANPYAGLFVSMAAGLAVGQSETRRANRKARDAWNASLRDQLVVVKGGVNARPIVYGRAAVGGQLLYAETTGSAKENLLMVIGLAHGEVDAIERIFFNETEVSIDGSNNVTTAPYYQSGGENVVQAETVPSSGPYTVTLDFTPVGSVSVQDGSSNAIWYPGDGGSVPVMLQYGSDFTLAGSTVTFSSALAGHVVQILYERTVSSSLARIWRYTGAAGQDISGQMAALGAPSWTAADKCSGIALLVVQLTFNENAFPSGIPNIKSVIRGRKCYDPRSGLTAWTQNAALCARDYLTLQYGVGSSSGKIDDTATTAAANICDEDVQLTATPTYQDRYTADGVISTADDRLSNLEKFAQAMAGSINYSQGKWRIRAGAYTAPALTLDESKLSDAGDISIAPYTTRRDLINGCKGTYINADKGYIEDQFPEWTSATFVSDDGGTAMTAAISLPLVTDSTRAQRLAKIAVYRTREALRLDCTCNFSTFAWQVGDMVSVNLARYGFTAKPFRIVGRGFSIEGGIRLQLREEPNGIYDWNLGEASVLSGADNTTLPNPASVAVPTITGITSAQWLYKARDGTFTARIRVAVTPPADQYVTNGGKLQLQYKRGDWSTEWVLLEVDGSATQIWIDPAFDGENYLIRVRAKNSAGFVSAWTAAQVHPCQGRPGQVVNLCLNSDFTQDLGYGTGTYPDARALRHWSSAASGMTPGIGRNYVGGTLWNIGRGGAWMYDGARVANGYYFIYQSVPVQAGVAYEASVYVSVHRCRVQFYLRFLDSGGNVIADAMGGQESLDAGAGTIGNPFDPTVSHRRLWRSDVSPTGTAYAQVLLLKESTNSGSSDSYAFWSKVMLCVAPTGVTKETATPWVDDVLNTVHGGVITPGSVTDVLENNPADSSTGWVNNNAGLTPNFTQSVATVSYTNSTPAAVFTVVTYSCLGSWSNSGLQAGGMRLISVLNGSLTTPTGIDLFNTNESTPTRELMAGTYSVVVPAGQTLAVTVQFYGARFAPGTCNTTVYWKDVQLNLQGIRK